MAHELSEDFVLSALSRIEFGVLGNVVGLCDIIELNNTVSVFVKLGERHHNEVLSALVHLSTDTSEEFLVGNSAVVVFVEVFEDAFKFRRAEFVAVFTETPHEFVAVKFLIAIIVHASEHKS